MADLTTKYLGLNLRNPIVIGSSGLTDKIEKLIELEKNGAGAVVLKSLFEEQILLEANSKLKQAEKNDMIYSNGSETLDYIDLHVKEKELNKYLELIREAKAKLEIPVIASINAISNTEWTGFAKQIEEAGADAIELNIFIMPFNFNKDCDENEGTYYSILRKVKEIVDIPVAVKISPYFANMGRVIMKLDYNQADSIVLFNKFSSPDIDIEKQEVTHADRYSKPSDMFNSLRWISLSSPRVKTNFAASTGIHDGESVIKFLLAGATVTQVVSAIYKNGPEKINEILSFIHEWMDEKGYFYIDQFRGKLASDLSDKPDNFERVQFMKYFSEIN
jgi:dihydroorotate dehydrogenase (fumarate)